MTKVTKLVMNGFKSFAKHTEIPLEPDLNIFIGPNGSGKSNIIDALCFVLGRISSKGLRAERLSHLIYNGGKFKKPATKAEVAIYFDNTDKTFPTDEHVVKVSRTVTAKGQSIYRINDEKRTRQQIIELLSLAKIDPNGYNIILQGDIIRFVEMTPEDRRIILEEVAGIGVYEDRKQKALNELERVEQRLKELEILLAERKTHLKELKSDRDQALKYKDMHDRIRQNRATYLDLQMKAKKDAKEKVEQGIGEQNSQIDRLKEDIAKLKELITQKKGEVAALSHEIEEKGEQEQVELSRSIEKLRVDMAIATNRIGIVEGELVKIAQRKEQLEKDRTEVQEKIAALNEKKQQLAAQQAEREKTISSLEREIATIQQGAKLADIGGIEHDIAQLEKEAEAKQAQLQQLSERKQNILRRKDQLEFQLGTIDEQIAKVDSIRAAHQKELDALKAKKEEFKSLVLELNKELSRDSSLAATLSTTRKKLQETSAELIALRAKDLAIQERAVSNTAVKAILEQNEIRGIEGTVSKLGNVPSSYALALEVAAGPRLGSIVVKDDNIAAQCIAYLKRKKLGIATFLPLNKIKATAADEKVKALLKSKGVIGLARDLVEFDSKYRNVFSYVFGSTLVIEDLDVARRLGIGTARMVTLEGDLMETSGAMQGGFRQKKARGGFAEKGLAKDISDLEKEERATLQEIEKLEQQRQDAEKNISRIKQRKAELEGDIIRGEKSLHLAAGEAEASAERKKGLAGETEKLDKELEEVEGKLRSEIAVVSELKGKRVALREKISQLHNPAMVAELNALQQKRQELRDEVLQIENDTKNTALQVNSVFVPEIGKIGDVLKGLEKEAARFREENAAAAKTIEKNRKELKLQEEKAATFKDKHRSLFAKRTVVMEDIQAQEENIIRKEEQINVAEVRINSVSVRNAELAAELSYLAEEFSQYSDVQLLPDASEDFLKKEIGKFERLMAQMGNVNLKALEIYDDVEKQYNSLHAKKETLDTERKDVLALMDEIEDKKKELFMNTFNVVNENFTSIFQTLSQKGEARLVIENENNPFAGGVFVKVRLTGNKFMDMRSLSGGEKSLTALALIFAIQEYEPASFYIFDEVDAALDKRNSEKVSGLMRQYADKAQYIVISHNDAVVSDAHTVFGVRMDEHGSSQVVSIKV